MRRRKLTPEVVVRSILTFVFGALTGYTSYCLVDLWEAHSVSATGFNPTLPRTLSDIKEIAQKPASDIYKPEGPTFPYLSWSPSLLIIKEPPSEEETILEEETIQEDRKIPMEESSNTESDITLTGLEEPVEDLI